MTTDVDRPGLSGARSAGQHDLMVGNGQGLPAHADLVRELRRLREKGLLRIRELDLPALEAVATAADSREPFGPRAVEGLLRRATDRLGDDDLGTATRTLFGLVQGTIGHKPTDLRERAAEVFFVSPETFRKDRERLIVSRLADELLTMAGDDRESLAAPTEPPRLSPERPAIDPGPPVAGLPADPATFVGRTAELAAVVAAFDPDDPRGVRVCVIHGIAGVGKSALAVRAARRLAERFPDGVMFLDLHGHSPDRPPEAPADVLGRLLQRVGVAPDRVSGHVDDRSALLSQALGGRRVLLVLDDAQDVSHLRPLIPASPGCGVIVTSRNRLAGLDEAAHVRLDRLPRTDSLRLFADVAGLARMDDADDVVQAIAAACADLPLALRVAAARHRLEGDETLGELAVRLADETGRLAELEDGARSVAAAFSVSCATLPAAGRHAFAVLSLHPGTSISPPAAAAMTAEAPERLRRTLVVLLDRHLLERFGGRYTYHDLMAVFARELATELLTSDERQQAFRRLADYYLVTAQHADRLLTPHRHQVEIEVHFPPAGLSPPATYAEALAWVRAEEESLVAVCRSAGERGLDTLCWQLAYTLRGWFFLAKRWRVWELTHEAALTSARRLGDRGAEAMTLNNLGLAAIEQNRLDVAARRYEAALALFREVGDRYGEHTAIANLAWLAFADGRYEEFVADLRTAFEFYDAHQERRNAAITLRGMALGELAAGRPRDAVEHLHAALAEFQALGGLPLDVAMTFNNLGEAYAADGALAEARRSHEEAVVIARDAGTTFEEARARLRLGDLAAAAGDTTAALAEWRAASTIYGDLRSPELPGVLERIAGHG